MVLAQNMYIQVFISTFNLIDSFFQRDWIRMTNHKSSSLSSRVDYIEEE